ncbi:T9SS type A sorting domain-containing protein, partial [uncultured Imperialibacter sp.]|uniref:T9SS type A sorting domain-containing protein n=1 Tax=uncultured Imperialibacter sp. TaxID=1672639 RepID=UPI0030DB4E68
EPVFRTGQLNGFPAVQFVNANSDYLQVADDASLDIQNVTLITVGNLAASSTAYASFLSKIQSGVAGFNGYALLRNNNLQSVSFAIDALGNEAQSAISYGVNAIHTGIYADPGMQHFVNEGGPSTDSYAGPITSHNTPLYIGGTVNAAGSTPDRFLEGDIAETIVFSSVLDNIKRIILSNYLSSKYGIAIANDFHTMDTPGNGNFDFQVSGIGQASDGSFHRDARGLGIVRMWNPSALANNEYLMWGHDNAALTGTTSGVDGIIIEQRYNRIWRVSETGDVGTVSISFDFNGIGNPLGSNLRLLIDRDGDGFADNDVTPIVGTVSGNIAVFSNVNFQNGDRFTLGNTDLSSPLPIELTSFKAFVTGDYVTVKWRTASELNNDFFTIEKSRDAESWQEVAIVNGAGTTQTPRQYQIIDASPFTTRSYYRLKQTDFDGNFDYSPIVLVKFDGKKDLHVFPNPSDGQYTLSIDHFDLTQVRLCNSLGQIVQASITAKDKFALIDISDAKPGVYVLQVFDGTSVRSARLVKN